MSVPVVLGPHVKQYRTNVRLHRWLNNTRRRALHRLAREYPERFRELLADERANGLEERP